MSDDSKPDPEAWDGWTIQGPDGYKHASDGVAHGYGPLRQFAGPGNKIAEVIYRPKAPGGPSFSVSSRNNAPAWTLSIDREKKLVKVSRK